MTLALADLPCPLADRAERWMADVLAGRVVAGRWARLAAERHRRDLAEAAAGRSPWRFDPIAAERACRFIEFLPHVEGGWAARGERVELSGWQAFLVASLHGWRERGTESKQHKRGLRRFRNAYVEVARKNGKTTLLAGLCLYALSRDDEIGGQVYSAAAAMDQARIVFDFARKMALGSPVIEQRAGLVIQKHEIQHPESGSKFVPLASQTKTLDGKGPSFVCLDELHAHLSRDVHDVLQSGMGAREHPLLVSITTAGISTGGICHELRLDVQRMLDGRIEAAKTDRLFGLIFCADEGDAPGDPATWAKANPNLGVSVSESFLLEEWRKAERNPAQLGEFLRKHLCIWTSAGAAAFDLDGWAAGTDTELTLEDFVGREAVIGLDGSKRSDLSSLAVVARRDGRLLLWTEHWATEETLDRPGNEHLRAWADAGWIRECPGTLIDQGDFERRVAAVAAASGAAEIAYDPQYLFGLTQRLSDQGHLAVEIGQKPSTLNAGFQEAMALVAGRLVTHRGDPAMTWMIGNTVAKDVNAGEWKQLRKIGPQDKIDGVQAWVTAMARLAAPEAPPPPPAEPRLVLL